jgi:hypothetical protein
MKFVRALDFRKLLYEVHKACGVTTGTGLIVGTRLFIGIVRLRPRMVRAKRRHPR